MKWSRYNRLFRSARWGRFVYNALSNTLLELDDEHYHAVEEFRDHQYDLSPGNDSDFMAVLRKSKVIVEEDEEKQMLCVRQYERHAHRFDSSLLGLTICPTLQCNFCCPYCFEYNQSAVKVMSTETVTRLQTFIQRYTNIRRLSVSWYGGEPTLAFDTICDITARIRNLDLDFQGAGMVTNGYLLGEEKIALLNELKINWVQITLDGPQEVHDARRVLSGGEPTFKRILDNVMVLMDSSYDGRCIIRVNVDKQNIDSYVELRTALLKQFDGKKLTVYPGLVCTSSMHDYDCISCLDLREWVAFNLDMYYQYNVLQRGCFYPTTGSERCVATMHHGFVVGPEGELYKCWEDVGKPAMVVGDIYEERPVTNIALVAQYSTGTDAYDDPACQVCDILPICGGGCANKRLRTKYFGEEGIEFCSVYRDTLIPCLEAYIDSLRTREICDAVLKSGGERKETKGYRVVSPKRRGGSFGG